MQKINLSYQSPNFDDIEINVKYVILHCMCLDDTEALEFLCDEKNGVSAHYYIARNGEVFNLVADNKKAWHAGISYWKEDSLLNDKSIGIELGNCGCLGDESSYTQAQYKSLAELLLSLKTKYNLEACNILAHSDIACDRKTDPGANFDWNFLYNLNIAKPFYIEDESLSYIDCIYKMGYSSQYKQEDVIKAFQRRFLSDRISGKLDNETKKVIDNYIKFYK